LGFVEFDQDKCSGCGYCVEHCPFSVPKLEGSVTTGIGYMNKCVFCIDRVDEGQQPACAEACPTGATKFGYRDELLIEGQARVDELRKTNPQANLYGVNEMGGLHVLYILDNTPEVWGLPSDPNLPPTTILHDVLEWVGMVIVPVVIAGFGFNYIVSRIRIAKEAKRERS
jgi:formate dehydrogenase iron-sulfur subunit